MKVYTYGPQELGFDAFPLGTLRLVGDDVIQIHDSHAADVFVLPPTIRSIVRGPGWGHIPHLLGNEARHVCFNLAEDMNYDIPPGMIAFRPECTKKMLARNPTTVAWPWPVKDIMLEVVFDTTSYDISFHGWVSTGLCERALQSIERSSLSHSIRRNKLFWGDIPSGHQELRRSYVKAMNSSLLVLSVKSHSEGVIRYRVYEAMTAGKVIIHVNDGCVYPLADRIDYDRFVVRVPEADVDRVGQIAEEYLRTRTALELLERGQYARRMWDRWLDSTYWPERMTEIVRELV